METQAIDSVVHHIDTSKQQFNRGTFGKRIVFDMCNRLLISMICQVQKARFDRYKRKLGTDSFCNTKTTTISGDKRFS